MSVEVTITGLDKLIRRAKGFPGQLNKKMLKTLEASLLSIQGSIPAYPSPPANSTYRRTGLLGRSLGVSMQGKGSGRADIYQAKAMGASVWEAQYGTRVKYAPDVIGDGTQKPIHEGRWWTIKTVARGASDKIQKHFETLAADLAKFLEGRGL